MLSRGARIRSCPRFCLCTKNSVKHVFHLRDQLSLIFSENSILRYVFVQKQAISKSISLKHENIGFRRMTLGMYVCVVLLSYIRLPGSFFCAHKVVCLYIIRYTHEKVFFAFSFSFLHVRNLRALLSFTEK